MNIKIDRTKFLAAINTVKVAVTNNVGLPILNNIKLETANDDDLVLTATNLDQTVSTTVKCQVAQHGSTTVPSKLISSMVGALTEQVIEFSKGTGQNDKAVLKGGDVTYKIATIPAEDYPKCGEVEGTEVVVKQVELREILKKTVYAASVDSTRRSLVSVCLQGGEDCITAVGTDGRRLATASINAKAEGEVVVPLVTVKFLIGLLNSEGDVMVRFSPQKAASFKTDTWNVTTKLIDDMYPNWKQVIPQSVTNRIECDRTQLIDAVRQVAFAVNETNAVLFVLKNNVLTLTASNSDVCDAKTMVAIPYDGEEIRITMNQSYFVETLNSFNSDRIVLGINDGTKPITLSADKEDGFAVIMPLRVA